MVGDLHSSAADNASLDPASNWLRAMTTLATWSALHSPPTNTHQNLPSYIDHKQACPLGRTDLACSVHPHKRAQRTYLPPSQLFEEFISFMQSFNIQLSVKTTACPILRPLDAIICVSPSWIGDRDLVIRISSILRSSVTTGQWFCCLIYLCVSSIAASSAVISCKCGWGHTVPLCAIGADYLVGADAHRMRFEFSLQ